MNQINKAMEWIDVKDKLPNENEFVLCARIKGGMGGYNYINPGIGMCRNGRFTCDMDWISTTHWMKLPENPVIHKRPKE